MVHWVDIFHAVNNDVADLLKYFNQRIKFKRCPKYIEIQKIIILPVSGPCEGPCTTPCFLEPKHSNQLAIPMP